MHLPIVFSSPDFGPLQWQTNWPFRKQEKNGLTNQKYKLYKNWPVRKEALSKKTLQTKRKKKGRRYFLTLKVLVLDQCLSHYSINAFKYLTNT